MKSAYELAMERLEKISPSGPPLTDEQKNALADLDKKYEAKIAERRILAEQDLQQTGGDFEKIQIIQERLKIDVRRLESERDEQKEIVRKGEKPVS